MQFKVRFRFNRRTGEVEEFLIDDYASNANDAEHNRQHDRIASEVAQVIARHPRIDEIHHADVLVSSEPAGREEPAEEAPLATPPQRQKQS